MLAFPAYPNADNDHDERVSVFAQPIATLTGGTEGFVMSSMRRWARVSSVTVFMQRRGSTSHPGSMSSSHCVGYDRQCVPDEPPSAGPSNLFTPVDGDRGARGDFDERARERDLIATATTWLGAAGVQLVIGLIALAVIGGALRLLMRR